MPTKARVPRTKATRLRCTGATSSKLTTPDSASVSVVGDLDVRAKVALTDWTPAAACAFVAKYVTGARSFRFGVNANGTVDFRFTSDGTTAQVRASTTATGVTDGATKWIRAVLDVDNGAAGHDVLFYTSDDGSSWSQLGTTVTTAGTTSLADTATSLTIGDAIDNNVPVTGVIYYAELRDGIDGTVVASFDAAAQFQHSRVFQDAQANIWAASGSAVVL